MSAIVHVVTWRVNGSTTAERQAQVAAIVAAVEVTRDRIPGLLALDVGANIVEHPDAWDVGAVMHFASRADLDAYHSHPAHLALKAAVGPLRSARSQLDFERRVTPAPCPGEEGR